MGELEQLSNLTDGAALVCVTGGRNAIVELEEGRGGMSLMLYKLRRREIVAGLCKQPDIFADEVVSTSHLRLVLLFVSPAWIGSFECLLSVSNSLETTHCAAGESIRPVESGGMKLLLPRVAARRGLGGAL